MSTLDAIIKDAQADCLRELLATAHSLKGYDFAMQIADLTGNDELTYFVDILQDNENSRTEEHTV